MKNKSNKHMLSKSIGLEKTNYKQFDVDVQSEKYKPTLNIPISTSNSRNFDILSMQRLKEGSSLEPNEDSKMKTNLKFKHKS